MSSERPKVSIVMATYNRAHLILETLNSIVQQSFANWECLIIDDGSTDDTAAVLMPYSVTEPRIHYHQRQASYKKGLPGCRNMGIDLSRGDYIIFFDDDDIVHPQNLELCVAELDQSSIDYCRFLRKPFWGEFKAAFERIGEYKVTPLSIADLEAIITNNIPFNSCQVMWRKECLANNRFNETLMYAEEWECYSRILAAGARGITIEKVLFFGRKHAASNTGEFQNKNSVRWTSKVKATELVIGNLNSKDLFTPTLARYFIRLGFTLRALSVIESTLKATGAGAGTLLKYRTAFYFYPVLRPFLALKGKLRH